MPLHTSTPLIESHALGQASGQNIWLKLDALQPCGSFKLRGIGHACETLAGQGKKRFVASSGGNAGIAVAYAGRQLSMPVTVVVPQTTTEHARALIRAQGAELIVHGSVWDEANALAQSLLGAAYPLCGPSAAAALFCRPPVRHRCLSCLSHRPW